MWIDGVSSCCVPSSCRASKTVPYLLLCGLNFTQADGRIVRKEGCVTRSRPRLILCALREDLVQPFEIEGFGQMLVEPRLEGHANIFIAPIARHGDDPRRRQAGLS